MSSGGRRDHLARGLDADGKLRPLVKTLDGVLLSYGDDSIDGNVNPAGRRQSRQRIKLRGVNELRMNYL
jgi:hypothetical protein